MFQFEIFRDDAVAVGDGFGFPFQIVAVPLEEVIDREADSGTGHLVIEHRHVDLSFDHLQVKVLGVDLDAVGLVENAASRVGRSERFCVLDESAHLGVGIVGDELVHGGESAVLHKERRCCFERLAVGIVLSGVRLARERIVGRADDRDVIFVGRGEGIGLRTRRDGMANEDQQQKQEVRARDHGKGKSPSARGALVEEMTIDCEQAGRCAGSIQSRGLYFPRACGRHEVCCSIPGRRRCRRRSAITRRTIS